MQFATVREARMHFSRFLTATKRGDLVITRNGKPIALLSGLSGEEFEDRLLEANPKFRRVMERRWRDFLKPMARAKKR